MLDMRITVVMLSSSFPLAFAKEYSDGEKYEKGPEPFTFVSVTFINKWWT